MNSYLKKMLYALTSAYSHRKDYDNLQSDKPVETNIGKLFSIFAWGLDKVQEQANLIKLWDNLDYAEGKVLDRYGANFGVKRGGASDLLYRLFIKVKMIAQLSSGDEDTVIKAAAEFLGVDYSDIYSEDVYPAKKRIYVDFSLLSDERKELIEQIAYAIKRTIAAGVGFRLYLRTYRTYVMPLQISRGSFTYIVDIGTDAGARRTKTLPMDMLHAGRAWSLLRGDIPPNVPRNYEQPFEVAHGGFFERGIKGYYSDTQDVIQSNLDISRGANIQRQFETYMPDSQQAHNLDANVTHGGFLRNERQAAPYGDKRVMKGNTGNSGAMCITRIKPRRIE